MLPVFSCLFGVECEPESAALADLAVCSVFGLVAFEDFSYYRESQSRATVQVSGTSITML